MSRIKYLKVELTADQSFFPRDAQKIRGYIGTEFNDDINIHNHGQDGYVYRYPLVQYKVVDHSPILVGLQSGVDSVWKVFQEIDRLNIGSRNYRLLDKSMTGAEVSFGIVNAFLKYQFQTPWYALNQKNFLMYTKTRYPSQRSALLTKILTGNILSMSKSLGVFITSKVQVADLWVSPWYFKLDDARILGFSGTFSVNFHIPDYLGIGKSVSRGFGTIKKIDSTSLG